MEGSISTKAAKPLFVESDIMTWSIADYERLLAELSVVFQSKPGDASYGRLVALADLIEAYEKEMYKLDEWAARLSTPEELAEHEATKRGDCVLVVA